MKIIQTLKNLLTPGQRLSQRFVFAGAWMSAMRITGRGLGIIRIIILARLLSPEAFGLVSIALLLMELFHTVTHFGFGQALIQRKGDINDHLDTVWSLSAIRGLILAGIIFSIAPLGASYFNAPDAKQIIQAMAAVVFINGFTNSATIHFYKELHVHKLFFWEMSGVIAELVVSISAAVILRNAWALVFGSIAANLTLMIASYIMHPYRPKPRLEIAKAKGLFSFGWWVLLSSGANYVFMNIDTIVVGRLLGVVTLGLYTMAHRIGDMIGREIYQFSVTVIFPAYAKLQDNLSHLRLAFSASIESVAYVTFPVAVGIYILASDFTVIILGEQWISAIPAMRIISIATAIYSLVSTGGSLFYAVGKPRFRFIVMLVAIIIMVGLLFPLIHEFGMIGAAWSLLAGNIGGLLVQNVLSARILKIGITELVKPLLFPIILSLVLGASLALTKYVFPQVSLVEFIIVLCLAMIVYAACSLLLWRLFKSGPVKIINILRARQ